jgi:hypothetical protein
MTENGFLDIPDFPEPFDFEAKLRELLTEDAEQLAPGHAPYSAIVRRGQAGRRRRAAAVGAGLMVLVALPGGALAATVNWSPDRHTSAMPAAPSSPAVSRSSGSVSTAGSPASPTGPQPPASAQQLRDGLTLKKAGDALVRCLGQYEGMAVASDWSSSLADYRILYAWKIDANANEGGSGTGVLAVSTTKDNSVLYCRDHGSTHNALEFIGDGAPARAITVDANASILYRQIGAWTFPYHWADFGTIDDPGVTRVTVSYGGATQDAFIDHGYFVTSGTLRAQPSQAPVVKGYDANGKLVYDSQKDKFYDKSVS